MVAKPVQVKEGALPMTVKEPVKGGGKVAVEVAAEAKVLTPVA